MKFKEYTIHFLKDSILMLIERISLFVSLLRGVYIFSCSTGIKGHGCG